MWLTCSSIGRKLVMAITGACLVLFVTFHAVMNGVAIFWPAAYNAVCAFLGANWYALVASAGLALLFVIHIIYALWLTLQNRKARGNDRYAVVAKPKQVEWASQNMLVLGIVVLAFLAIHLIQFWAKMQLAEIMHCPATDGGVAIPPQAGTKFLEIAFSQPWTLVVYIIGLIALWFHMNHGFWSMMQSAGWNGQIWLPRLKAIGCWWITIVVALFLVEAVVFTVQANRGTYSTCPALIEQYNEFSDEMGSGFDRSVCSGEAFTCGKAECTTPQCGGTECTSATCGKAECDPAKCASSECSKAECAQAECAKAECPNK